MTTQGNKPVNVNIDPGSVNPILDALKALTDVIAGRSAQDARQPSAEQARVIVDYDTLSFLLGRPGRGLALVPATRNASNEIIFVDRGRIPQNAVKASVTPRRGRTTVYDIETVDGSIPVTKVRLRQADTAAEEPLVRVELQTGTGIPVALCPRLPAAPGNGVD